MVRFSSTTQRRYVDFLSELSGISLAKDRVLAQEVRLWPVHLSSYMWADSQSGKEQHAIAYMRAHRVLTNREGMSLPWLVKMLRSQLTHEVTKQTYQRLRTIRLDVKVVLLLSRP